ncbi:hypothetical protein J4Q44_G00266400 [Coregonus suidteri]|uniref:Uncharacterized protein n=1 Tax=Coregonus suidteri TaxID=861788 RepID=A0AAN8QF51_9TELE
MHSLLTDQLHDNCLEEKTRTFDPNGVMAEIKHGDRPGVEIKYSNVSPLELDKFLEDVKNGIYPLMNFQRGLTMPRTLSIFQERMETVKTPSPEPQEMETRKVVQMHCNLEFADEGTRSHLSLLLKMDDKLQRQLNCDVLPTDSAKDLASELVYFAFISEEDCEKLAGFLEDALCKHWSRPPLEESSLA